MTRTAFSLVAAFALAVTASSAHAAADRFGDAVAACDFDGDGFDDLAIGVPGQDVGSNADAGAVNVVYGGPRGVRPNAAQFIDEGDSATGSAEAGDRFGAALGAGDFDHDGFCDLAIGIPGEDVGTAADAGAVRVLYGSPRGLRTDGDQLWTQNSVESSAAVEGVAEAGDGFGSALAVGDFDGDGFADLVIGVPNEDVGKRVDAGAVNVLYGTARGLSAVRDQDWNQNSPNVNDFCEAGDHFGAALATADFNGDGFDDLAIGVPGEDLGRLVDAGAVNVLYGTAARGLYTINDQLWDQNKAGIEGIAERDDHFGASLAAGDFNGDGFGDLAIGVPNEDVGAIVDAGAVNVLYGTRNRLSYLGDQQWHRNKPDVEGDPAANEHFGTALAAGDFDHDGFTDLAIGVPDQDVGLAVDAGAVQVLYGGANRLTGVNDQIFTQNTLEVNDAAQAGDRFGSVLTTRDFNGDGFTDLAVGVPDEDVGTVVDAGAVAILYGNARALSAAGDQFLTQGSLHEGTTTTTTVRSTTTTSSTRPGATTTSTVRASTTTTTRPGPGLTAANWNFYARIARNDGSESNVSVPKRATDPPVGAAIRTDHIAAFPLDDQVTEAEIAALGGDTLARLSDAARLYLASHPADYPDFARLVALVWAKRK